MTFQYALFYSSAEYKKKKKQKPQPQAQKNIYIWSPCSVAASDRWLLFICRTR